MKREQKKRSFNDASYKLRPDCKSKPEVVDEHRFGNV